MFTQVFTDSFAPHLYEFPIAAITICYKLSSLNKTIFFILQFYGPVLCVLLGPDQGVDRAAFLSGSFREDPFLCPFHLLEDAHVPGLRTLFLQLHSQPVGPSLSPAAFSPASSSASLFHITRTTVMIIPDLLQ